MSERKNLLEGKSRQVLSTAAVAVVGGLALLASKELDRPLFPMLKESQAPELVEDLNFDPAFRRTDNRLEVLADKMRQLSKANQPWAYQESFTHEGDDAIRYVVSREALDLSQPEKEYLQVVLTVKKGQSQPFSAAIIWGAKNQRFTVGREFEKGNLLIRSENPLAYDLEYISIEDGLVITEERDLLYGERAKNPRSKTAVSLDNFTEMAKTIVMLPPPPVEGQKA